MYGLTHLPALSCLFSPSEAPRGCVPIEKSFANAICLCFVQLVGQRGIRDRDEIATAVVCGPAAASATVLLILLSFS